MLKKCTISRNQKQKMSFFPDKQSLRSYAGHTKVGNKETMLTFLAVSYILMSPNLKKSFNLIESNISNISEINQLNLIHSN